MSDSAGDLATTDRSAEAATVRDFLAALERFDLDAAATLLDAGVEYENVSLPVAHGREATMRLLRTMVRRTSGFEATIHRLVADGATVLTERTDAIVVGKVRIAFWVCGTFEVHDGRITLWRDYFDWAAVTGGAVVGLARALLGRGHGSRTRTS